MSETNNDLNHPILNLTPQEKQGYSYLFAQADKDSLGVVTGENAVSFFERTKLSPATLGEIWQIADTENRGLLTKPGFCMVLRLIGHYQSGKEPSTELAFKPAPLPKFDGMTYPGQGAPGLGSSNSAQPSPTTGQFPANALQPQMSGQGPIRVPPLDSQKAIQYSGLFDRSGAQNGMLDGVTAKSIFERAGLPNDVLGRIWNLSDREQRGALDQTEFIVAMHLLTSMKTRAMSALPSTLPPGLYEAAARRGAPPPPGARQPPGRVGIPAQYTGSGVGASRTQSPLTARPQGFGTPPPMSAQSTGPQWLISPPEKAKYDQFFSNVDKQGRGAITGEQAVTFFSDSGLPEDTLASIWDLADINSEGQLTKDEFAVAMYLIKQQRIQNAPALPAFLPPALIPPSMRKQQLPLQQQASQPSTAPAFDNANNTSNLPKSAADDLFGLDDSNQPSQPSQPPLQPQSTGMSAQGAGAGATRDPFQGSQPQSPSSPQRFQPQPQQAAPSTMFKPFMPTSQFGTSLQQQNTGGSQGSAAGQGRNFSAPVPQQATGQPQTAFGAATAQLPQPTGFGGGGDDLLGDNETHAAESSKMTNETTELANMSNQIGNLTGQMKATQNKKLAAEADLNATNMQKRDLELRLQQFRSQYETEVRTVKELESQLASSKESTKKLGQELAMLEGTYQDLSTQHQNIATQLQTDQQENNNLKQRISQLNGEVARLKPEIERLQMEARKERGMVSINKKQLTTNEGERDRFQSDKSDLERAAEERARSPPIAPETVARSAVASPASMVSSTNPFFRKASEIAAPVERSVSPSTAMAAAPTPSAFDTLFGPAFSAQADSRTGTPPATSFVGRSIPPAAAPASASTASAGEPTPNATPPLPEQAKDSQMHIDGPPPPPPENRQFTPGMLGPPVGAAGSRSQSVASSTRVIPPQSRAGGIETPLAPASRVSSPSPAPVHVDDGAFAVPPSVQGQDTGNVDKEVPGAFPDEDSTPAPHDAPSTGAKDDFESAFAGLGESDTTKDGAEDPFAPAATEPAEPRTGALASEFPPIRSLEKDVDSDSDSDSESEPGNGGFDDNFASSSPPRNPNEEQAPIAAVADHGPLGSSDAATAESQRVERRLSITEAQARPTVQTMGSNASSLPGVTAQQSPPTYEESDSKAHGGSGERTDSNSFPPEFRNLLPAREDPTSPPPPATSAPVEIEHSKGGTSDGLQTPTAYNNPQVPAIATSGGTTAANDVFHDASSRPVSGVTDVGPAAGQTAPSDAQASSAAPASQDAFDDFGDFGDLSEAKEDRGDNNFDFGFGHSRNESSEFNPAFDSPAASTTNTMTSAASQATPRAESTNGFANNSPFGAGATTGNSSIQHTPQNAQHDWDAIFSGLDSSKTVDTSFGGQSDPWGSTGAGANGFTEANNTPKVASLPASSLSATSPVASSQPRGASIGRAITPGTEHDDPILKRLTGMGYPRTEALNALEMYDYDINRAVDHLTSK